jgi:hypothetical protein
MAMSLLYIGTAGAAQPEKIVSRKKVGEQQLAGKSVTGTISYVDKKYVSIVISRNNQDKSEEEIGFWIDESEQEGWRKKLSEMKTGDRIEIEFDDVIQEYDMKKEDGTVERKTMVDEHKAKSVKFLSPAPTQLRSE